MTPLNWEKHQWNSKSIQHSVEILSKQGHLVLAGFWDPFWCLISKRRADCFCCCMNGLLPCWVTGPTGAALMGSSTLPSSPRQMPSLQPKYGRRRAREQTVQPLSLLERLPVPSHELARSAFLSIPRYQRPWTLVNVSYIGLYGLSLSPKMSYDMWIEESWELNDSVVPQFMSCGRIFFVLHNWFLKSFFQDNVPAFPLPFLPLLPSP